MLVILAILLALALVLGTLIPQVPAGLAGDPTDWSAAQPGLLGQADGLFQVLGLFDLYHALWFRLLLALAGLAIFCSAAESAEIAWRATRGQWTAASLALWGRHPLQVHLPAAQVPAEAQTQARSFLTIHGYRWTEVSGAPAGNAVASRRAALCWAQPASLAGLLLALLGLAIVAALGWQSAAWQPAVGDSYVIGHGTPYTLRLDTFEAGDRAGVYHSHVTWLQDEQPAHTAELAVGRPAAWRGLAVRQVDVAPAVTLRGTDPSGRSLLFQSTADIASPAEEIAVVLDPSGAQHLVLIANQDFFLLLSPGPAAGSDLPGLQVEMVNGVEGEQRALGILRKDRALAVDGLQVQFDLSYRPVLRLDSRPGMILVIGGLALAVLALAVGWLFPPRLLWLATSPATESPALVYALAVGGLGQASWFARLAAQLRAALAHDD